MGSVRVSHRFSRQIFTFHPFLCRMQAAAAVIISIQRLNARISTINNERLQYGNISFRLNIVSIF